MTQDLNRKDGFAPKTNDGEFIRVESGFRSWITKDGSAGPSGVAGFKAENNRYHLYISHACPWANRVMIMRNLKQLQDFISVDVVHPLMGAQSWHFEDYPDSTLDTVNGKTLLRDVYAIADPTFNGVVTVPVLWDKKKQTVVNNESSEIIRIFDSAFNDLTGNAQDYYPIALQSEIDEINHRVYNTVNNGVYRTGFASTQSAYETAVTELFDTLEYLEQKLAHQQWLAGDQFTEADIRLFVTLIRFDAVYHGHFKCNLKRISDYPNLTRHTQTLYAMPEIKDTIKMRQIKYHYYASHTSLNPSAIVPLGPSSEFDPESP